MSITETTAAPAEADAAPLAKPSEDTAAQSRWYALGILTLIYSCHYLDRSVISIVLEPIRAEFGLSDGQLGLLTGMAYGLTFAVAGIPLGILIDRVGCCNLLAILVFLWSGFTTLAGFAQSFTHLLLARMGVGAAEAGGSPASLSMISDLFPPKQRSTAIGVFFLSNAIGAGLSAVIGAHVAAIHGWRAAFFVAGGPGLVLVLLLILTVREPRRGAMDPVAAKPQAVPPLRTTLRFLGSQKALVHLFIAMPLVVVAAAAMGAWLPAYLMRSHAMDLKTASITTAISFGVFTALGSFFGGMLCDRLARNAPWKRVAFAGTAALLSAPACIAATVVADTPIAVAFVFVTGMLIFATIPAAFGSMVGLAKPRMRGVTLSSIQVLTNLLGYGFGPYAVGLLSDLYGGPQMLRYAIATVMAGSLLWATLHFVAAARSFQAGLARAAEE